jgi:hypothetical protein
MATAGQAHQRAAPLAKLPLFGAAISIAATVAAPGIFTNFQLSKLVLAGLGAIPCLIAVWLIFTSPRTRFAGHLPAGAWVPTAAMLFLGAIALLRGGLGGHSIAAFLSVNTGMLALIQCVLAVAAAICVAASPIEHRHRLITAAFFHAFLWSCTVQFAADLTGAFSAITKQTASSLSPSDSLAMFGITRDRMQMVFASGLNASVVYPIVLLLGSVLYKNGPLFLRVGGGLLACYLLLAIDSRAAIVGPILAILLLPLTEKWPRFMATVCTTLPAWPLVLMAFAAALPDFVRDVLTSRYADYGMFSGREYIWSTSLSYFLSGEITNIIVGFGSYGQAISGVDALYAPLFASYSQNASISGTVYSLHNSFVQTLFDAGLLGLIGVAWATWTTLARLSRSSSNSERGGGAAARFLIAILVTFLIVGMTEVTFTPYQRESFGLLAIVLILSVTMFPEVRWARRARSAGSSRGRAHYFLESRAGDLRGLRRQRLGPARRD